MSSDGKVKALEAWTVGTSHSCEFIDCKTNTSSSLIVSNDVKTNEANNAGTGGGEGEKANLTFS
jgi:hypothetical protein